MCYTKYVMSEFRIRSNPPIADSESDALSGHDDVPNHMSLEYFNTTDL